MNQLIILLIISLIFNVINFIMFREYKKFNEFDKMLLLRRIEILKDRLDEIENWIKINTKRACTK